MAVITGTRAEFGLLEPVLKALILHPGTRPQLIATGMHLLPRFGHTIQDIRNRGWRIDAKVRMQTGRDDVRDDPQAVSRGIAGIARALCRLKSDIAVVLGDRIEAFAGASAAALLRIPVAHIHGGDRATGQTDDALRNAITRLAHIHLVASQDARMRLLKMGEAAWRIHRVGAPGLDDIREQMAASGSSRRRKAGNASNGVLRAPAPALREFDAASTDFALVVQHPASADASGEHRTMRDILWAVERCGLAGVVVYPNSDAGHTGITRAIHELNGHGRWRIHRSLPRDEYLRVARAARVLIGNSSSGIIESASLGLCAVNIGPRQNGRLRCGRNVIDVPAERQAILRGIRTALRRPRPRRASCIYGDGRAGPRIAAILKSIRIDERLLLKELTY